MRVVSVGECMVELAPLEAAETYRLGYAGDTLNTAWYLARLRPGWAVDFVTALGTDPLSDSMIAFFEAAGIGTAHIARDPRRTPGLYMISLRDGERSFSYWRGQSAARRLAGDGARLDAAFDGADVILVTGITLAILEDGGRGKLLSALARARAKGSLIVFDPNLRPRLWEDAETMCAVVTEVAAASDVVLPSHDDEATWFGDADPQATCERYRKLGAATIVVKNGGGPILHRGPAGKGEVVPPAVARVVDSTAAGDSFNAGLLSALLEGADLPGAIEAGCRLAGRVIGARGALVEEAAPVSGH